ncbi:MAG: MFS transporter [Gemmataceae bacterium]
MGPSSDSSETKTGLNEKILFWASFLTLIAAGIGFSVRGVIIADWGQKFGFTQSELGTISGGGLVGFGLAIIFFSFFADLFGYGKLMTVAFLLHASSAIVTFAATPVYGMYGKHGAFMCLNLGMWLFAFGNGTCEAVINPLTASLFPRNKTHWLNILHAGWPLGLILGVVITLGFGQMKDPIRWEYKLGVFLIPVLMYGLLMFNRKFPKSEAESAGISTPDMMGTIGFLGFAVAALFLGFAIPNFLSALGIEVSSTVGYIISGVIWLIYTVYSKFSPGSLLLGFLYLLHALVGYVELGTDSWITNITTRVLKSETNAQLAFVWTNVMMFILRFFAGPIVHKINPIGLLMMSAILGTAGLAMLGMPFTDSVWPWVAAVSIYGIGKTFYWPTLLGVISERFPKGGALAIGLSGGIGMISAGFFGGPGIGYKQDYLAVQNLKEKSEATYERYKSEKETGFPIFSEYAPMTAPKVAGLDNAKLKVFDDYKGNQAKIEEAKKDGKPAPADLKTTLESDLETLKKEKDAGKEVPEKLEVPQRSEGMVGHEGQTELRKVNEVLEKARDHGAKTALLYTAAVPAALAIGFLLLLLYFTAIGGYKQVHIDDKH